MENKKDIGKAFREKLDGLQKAPSPAVWDSISANLPKKKRGFLFLLWGKATVATKIAAVTAAILMGIVVGYIAGQNVGSHQDNGQNNAPTVNSDTQTGSVTNNDQVVSGSEGSNANATQNATESGSTSNEDETNTPNNKVSGKTNSVVSGSESDNSVVTNSASASAKKAKNVNRSAKANNASAPIKNDARSSRTATGVANTSTTKNSNTVASANKNSNASKSKKKRNGKAKSAKQGGIASAKANTATGVAANKEREPDHTKISKVHSYATGPITYKGIEIDTTDAEPADTVMMVSRQRTTGVTQYLERVKADTTTSDLKKWYAMAYVAPTQYEFPKNESLLYPSLNGNATSTDVVYNYGAYIGYNFNDKWSVRGGVLKSRVEQLTKNINFYYTAEVTPPIEPGDSGIDYDSNSSAALSAFYGSSLGNYNIKHKLEFVEIPVEVTYNIFDKKIGMNAFAGGSIINVTENNVYAYNQNGSVLMGSARNIEKTGFTGNLGLSFYYRFLPNLQVNAEPVFKYYFNTFDAKPYSLGLQLGLQYNFDIKK